MNAERIKLLSWDEKQVYLVIFISISVYGDVLVRVSVHGYVFVCTCICKCICISISLLGATEGKVSQLERLVFSENFVKEESDGDDATSKRKM